jgi:hypothetical protein
MAVAEAYTSRICEHCTINEIGDEMHLVFDFFWFFPAEQHVRDQYADVFTFATSYSTMRTFLWQDDIISGIKYVVAFMDILGWHRLLRTNITSMRIVIKHMQNGISSGCSASNVKCQVSNHKPVGGAGETNGWYRLGGRYFRRVSRHVLTCTCLALGVKHLVAQFGLTLTSTCLAKVRTDIGLI